MRNIVPQYPQTGDAEAVTAFLDYHGPPDPLLEKLCDRGYTRKRSRLVDRWVEYKEMEGF
jgi:hypothetical protein